MTFPHRNDSAEPAVGELPAFVKRIPAESSALPAVHYWLPERTGDPEADYQLGRQHFREAAAFSCRPDAQMFLTYVLAAMFQNVGPIESGFINALHSAALVGRLRQL
jgi:hypothetical protein